MYLRAFGNKVEIKIIFLRERVVVGDRLQTQIVEGEILKF